MSVLFYKSDVVLKVNVVQQLKVVLQVNIIFKDAGFVYESLRIETN